MFIKQSVHIEDIEQRSNKILANFQVGFQGRYLMIIVHLTN